MSDQEFNGLRRWLEAGARPPDFTQIRARRAARTRRVGIAGAALATVVVLAGGGTAVALLRGGGPISPFVDTLAATASPTSTEKPVAARNGVAALAATAAGRLLVVEQRCVADCDSGPREYEYTLLSSPDLGASWSPVAQLPGQVVSLLAADETHLWTVLGPTVSGSADGGKTWLQWSVGPLTASNNMGGAVAGGVAWFFHGQNVWRATAGGEPKPAGSVTGDGVAIAQLTPIDGHRAYALATLPAGAAAAWQATTDGGAHWPPSPTPAPAPDSPARPSRGWPPRPVASFGWSAPASPGRARCRRISPSPPTTG